MTLHPCALSHQTGGGQLYISSENKGDHTLIPLTGRSSVDIDTSTFDELFKTTRSTIKCVKIDVQGYELAVLRGMKETLSAGRIEQMVIEFTPQRLKRAGEDPQKFIEYLLSLEDFSGKVISSTSDEKYTDLPSLGAHAERLAQSEFNAFNIHMARKTRHANADSYT